jgi:cytochrome c peroxidase
VKIFFPLALACLGLVACGGDSNSKGSEPALQTKASLGEALFHDVNLSANRTQACSTCHNPEHGFVDDRHNVTSHSAEGAGAVSLGDDGTSLGDRNAPTAAYASVSPAFEKGTQTRINSKQPDYDGFIGGQFHDGRSSTLSDQAEGPPLNAAEMGMVSEADVVARLQENQRYVQAFETLYGAAIWDDATQAYKAMADAIAEFEKTDVFAPFDSKYDRSLLPAGDPNKYMYDPLSKADSGRVFFFSQQFTNCATCHQLKPQSRSGETFTGYEYHNIGVPKNLQAQQANGRGPDFTDPGLLDNPAVTEESERGKYKVPTLRNVAITGPYMHNGVFAELDTVIRFYDHFLAGSTNTLNPETGVAWRDPKVPETVSVDELNDGPKLSEAKIEALVCFMLTLTDKRYEHLISQQEWDNCEKF